MIVFGHLLHDILSTLSKVSLTWQRQDASIHECFDSLQGALLLIRKFLTTPGFFLSKVQDDDCSVVTDAKYCGVDLKGNLDQYNKEHTEVVTAVIMCLEQRFSDISDGLLASTKIANLKTWPSDFHEDFGDENIKILCKHFGERLDKVCSLPDIQPEWTLLQKSLYENHKNEIHSDSTPLTWEKINKMYKESFPNCLQLFDLLLSLPASSAVCERGFSQMKIIKNEYRNRMGNSSLCDLILIKLHSPEVADFDPCQAIHYWNSSSSRARRTDRNSTLAEQEADGAAAAAAAHSVNPETDKSDMGKCLKSIMFCIILLKIANILPTLNLM